MNNIALNVEKAYYYKSYVIVWFLKMLDKAKMELSVDFFPFNLQINHIRLIMNMVLNREHDTKNQGFDLLHLRTDIRNEIREWVSLKSQIKLIISKYKVTAQFNCNKSSCRLLERDRPSVEETYGSGLYSWVVPTVATAGPLKKDNKSTKEFTFHRTDVFPLHSDEPVSSKDHTFSQNDYDFCVWFRESSKISTNLILIDDPIYLFITFLYCDTAILISLIYDNYIPYNLQQK